MFMIPQIYQIRLMRVKIASSFPFDFEKNVLSKMVFFFFPELVHSGDTAQITVSSIQKQLILRSLRL